MLAVPVLSSLTDRARIVLLVGSTLNGLGQLNAACAQPPELHRRFGCQQRNYFPAHDESDRSRVRSWTAGIPCETI
jgi:hypothetical protein